MIEKRDQEKQIPAKQNQQPFTEVYVWGGDHHGQLGLGHQYVGKNYTIPKICSYSLVIVEIACGEEHSVFVTERGHIYSIGSNEEGKLGINNRSIRKSSAPCLVEDLCSLLCIKISCGSSHTAALMDNGEVYSWGYGEHGALGTGQKESKWAPAKIILNQSRSSTIHDVSCGSRHTLLLNSIGSVLVCGANESGQLGTGKTEKEMYVQQLQIEQRICQIAAGAFHSLFLGTSGQVFSCGGNSFGQLGTGNQKNSQNLCQVLGLEEYAIAQIAAGHHSSAITRRGELFIWGTGVFGEYLTPFQFAKMDSAIVDVSVGGFFGAAADINGNVWTWGSNNNGELGVGDFEPRISPFPVAALQGRHVTQISCGSAFVMALGVVQNPNNPQNIKLASNLNHREDSNQQMNNNQSKIGQNSQHEGSNILDNSRSFQNQSHTELSYSPLNKDVKIINSKAEGFQNAQKQQYNQFHKNQSELIQKDSKIRSFTHNQPEVRNQLKNRIYVDLNQTFIDRNYNQHKLNDSRYDGQAREKSPNYKSSIYSDQANYKSNTSGHNQQSTEGISEENYRKRNISQYNKPSHSPSHLSDYNINNNTNSNFNLNNSNNKGQNINFVNQEQLREDPLEKAIKEYSSIIDENKAALLRKVGNLEDSLATIKLEKYQLQQILSEMKLQLHNMQKGKGGLEELSSSLNNQIKRFDDLKGKYDNVSMTNAQLLSEIKDVSASNEKLRTQITEKTHQNNQIVDQLKQREKENFNLLEHIKELQGVLEEKQQIIIKLEIEKKNDSDSFNKQESGYREEIKRLGNIIENLNQDFRAAQEANRAYDLQLNQVQQQYFKLENSKKSCQSQIQHLNNQLQSLESVLEKETNERRQFEEAFESQQKVRENTEKQNKNYLQEIQYLKNALNQQEEIEIQLNERLNKTSEQRQTLYEQLASMNNLKRDLANRQEQLSDSLQRINALNQNLIQVEEQNSKLVELLNSEIQRQAQDYKQRTLQFLNQNAESVQKILHEPTGGHNHLSQQYHSNSINNHNSSELYNSYMSRGSHINEPNNHRRDQPVQTSMIKIIDSSHVLNETPPIHRQSNSPLFNSNLIGNRRTAAFNNIPAPFIKNMDNEQENGGLKYSSFQYQQSSTPQISLDSQPTSSEMKPPFRISRSNTENKESASNRGNNRDNSSSPYNQRDQIISSNLTFKAKLDIDQKRISNSAHKLMTLLEINQSSQASISNVSYDQEFPLQNNSGSQTPKEFAHQSTYSSASPIRYPPNRGGFNSLKETLSNDQFYNQDSFNQNRIPQFSHNQSPTFKRLDQQTNSNNNIRKSEQKEIEDVKEKLASLSKSKDILSGKIMEFDNQLNQIASSSSSLNQSNYIQK